MGLLVVGVGDCRITRDAEAELVTYALGSCIAVGIWDPATRVAGLLHYMLPEGCPEREQTGQDSPFRYADTGIPLLFRGAYAEGAEKSRLVVRVAGGASVVDNEGFFNIGKKNYAALRKILWKAGVPIDAEDCGGMVSRTVRMEVATGRMWVRTPGEAERELLSAARQGGVPCQNV